MKRRAVFLDRDGVLNNAIIRNRKPYTPSSLCELTIPVDAKSALANLKSARFLLIGATNQPDVARKKISIAQVEAINASLTTTLELDDIRVCYHDDADNCACRKPKPGLIIQAALDHHVSLKDSFMIGDRWKDVEAGIAAGCRTIWLNSDYDEPQPPRAPDFTTTSLSEAAEWILQQCCRVC